jgi:hypothetical protein
MHALCWRYIDFDRAEVTIETRADRYGSEEVTKTAAGMLSIPLVADVLDVPNQSVRAQET